MRCQQLNKDVRLQYGPMWYPESGLYDRPKAQLYQAREFLQRERMAHDAINSPSYFRFAIVRDPWSVLMHCCFLDLLSLHTHSTGLFLLAKFKILLLSLLCMGRHVAQKIM